jgi:ribosomal protein S18 acetylase RimI-like enzyme
VKVEYLGLRGTYRHYHFFTTGGKGQEPIGEYELRWPEEDRVVVEIWNFEVYPKFQGKGYAKKLMKSIIRRATEDMPNDRVWLRLVVKQRNYKAIRLYKAFGFVVAARHDHSRDFVMTRFLDGH